MLWSAYCTSGYIMHQQLVVQKRGTFSPKQSPPHWTSCFWTILVTELAIKFCYRKVRIFCWSYQCNSTAKKAHWRKSINFLSTSPTKWRKAGNFLFNLLGQSKNRLDFFFWEWINPVNTMLIIAVINSSVESIPFFDFASLENMNSFQLIYFI